MTKTDTEILDGLVSDWLTHKESIDKHQQICDQIAVQIIDKLPAGAKHEVVPGVGVRVQSPTATFNADQAAKILTPEQLSAISESRPSAALAKKFLPGALVEQCRVASGKASVRRLS